MSFISRVYGVCRDFARSKSGAVAIITAAVLVPVLALMGFVVDYNIVRAERNRMHAILDSVLLSAAQEMSTQTDEQLRRRIRAQLDELADRPVHYRTLGPITIDRNRRAISTIVDGSTSPFFGRLYGKRRLAYSFITEVIAPSERSYDEIYFLLDDSASMLFTADDEASKVLKAEQIRFKKRNRSKGLCIFACHAPSYNDVDLGRDETGPLISSREIARRKNVKLRVDILGDAIQNVLSSVSALQEDSVKLGIYYFSEDVYMRDDPTTTDLYAPKPLGKRKPVLRPPERVNVNLLKSNLTDYENIRIDRHTHFKQVLQTMTRFVGPAGDGSSAASPRKLVLMVTDGVNGTKEGTNLANLPVNPEWCSQLKRNNVSLAVLYTGYPHVPADPQYRVGIGQTMFDISRRDLWENGAVEQENMSLIGRDYLPIALRDCASPGMFARADKSDEIINTFEGLLRSWVDKLRISK